MANMAVQLKIQKSLTSLNDEKEGNKEHLEAASTVNLNAPKHGTVIPNRVFVGGIAPATTEMDLVQLFSSYGNVTGSKIISDRAGVSKGYGFVTFETEDEAKRLQKDADNIVLGQRRLNIAPAIKKQSFGRGTYECNAGSPLPPTQVYRHNGITYTFHNGMAFFPQPAPQAPPSSHVEPTPVFQSGGASYGTVAPTSPGPAYQFSYAPQGQIFYQPPQYQYHLPQYDGYEGGQMMVTDGSLVIPQYYLTPQPAPELAYYQQAAVHPPDNSGPSVQQVIYASPRAYESTLVYSTEQKSGMENCASNHGGSMPMLTHKEEGDPAINNQRRSREQTPVVSLLKGYKGKDEQPRRKPHHYHEDGRRQHHLNNNNPDTTNRNLKHQEGRRSTPPSAPSYPPTHASPNPRHPPVQVPQFPFYPRQVLAPTPALASCYPPPQHTVRPRSCYRPRYGGGRGGARGGGGGAGSKWLAKEEELGQPLTPPITPRSEPAGVPGTTAGPEDVVQSIQALAI